MSRSAPRIDLFDVRPDDERAVAFARDLRVIEALLFSSAGPVEAATLKPHLSPKADLDAAVRGASDDPGLGEAEVGGLVRSPGLQFPHGQPVVPGGLPRAGSGDRQAPHGRPARELLP